MTKTKIDGPGRLFTVARDKDGNLTALIKMPMPLREFTSILKGFPKGSHLYAEGLTDREKEQIKVFLDLSPEHPHDKD